LIADKDAEQQTIEQQWAISAYNEALRERRENQAAWCEYLRNQARTFRGLADDCEYRAERVASTSVEEDLDLKLAPGRGERW
jgi:hypothetical protein